MFLLRPLVCLALLTVPTAARPTSVRLLGGPARSAPHALDSRVESGQTALVNLRLHEAEAQFAAYSAALPDDPLGPLLASQVPYLRILVTGAADSQPAFDRAIDIAIHRADDLAASDPARAALYEADALLARSTVQMRLGSYVKGALNLRRAHGHYQDALRLDPTLVDAYRGLGLIHIAVGAIPPKFGWMARTIGLTGDRPLGLRELGLAAERGGYTRVEAELYLAVVHTFYRKDPAAGIPRLEALARRYPTSPLVAFTLGFGYRQNRRLTPALAQFDRVLSAPLELPAFGDLSRGERAEVLFRLDRYSEAAAGFDAFLRTATGPTMKALAAYRLGLCRDLLGDRAGALAAYRTIQPRDDYSEDVYAARKAAERIAAAPDAYESALLRGRNAFDRGDWSAATILLTKVASLAGGDADRQAEAAYWRGRVAQTDGRAAAAAGFYSTAVALDGRLQRETWYVPQARFRLGQLAAEAGRATEARADYRAALKYSDYDYEKGLRRDLGVALDGLDHPVATADE